MPSVRTLGAGTAAPGRQASVSGLDSIHALALPTPLHDDGRVYVYVVKEDPVTLIDAGVRDAASRAALEAGLDRLGLGIEDIERVVLTHHHVDQLGQVQSLRDSGAGFELWAHLDERPMIEDYSIELLENIENTDLLFWEHGVPVRVLEGHNAWRRRRVRELGVLCEPSRVDHTVRDGDRVPFKGFELQVIHAPGHTAGHILLHEEQSGILFTGDHILSHSVPFTETYYTDREPDPSDPVGRRPRFKGLPEYLRSVRSLSRGSYRKVLPAHGAALGRANRLIEDSLLFYDVRVQRIHRGLRKLAAMGQDVTAWDMWTALFPKADQVSELRTSMQMVIGALDVLEEAGDCITSRRDDGILVHTHS